MYLKGRRPEPPPCIWGPALQGTAQDLFASGKGAAEVRQEFLQEFWQNTAKQESPKARDAFLGRLKQVYLKIKHCVGFHLCPCPTHLRNQ